MKTLRLIIFISLTLVVLLSACAPASTPTSSPTSAPASTSTEIALPAVTSTTVPVSLVGPEMKVGSTYLYFDGTTLVAVPGGPFTMGNGTGVDHPEHSVTVNDFWIYSTKVTNNQYQQCVTVGLCTAPDPQNDQGFKDSAQANNPVTGVNWTQAEAYCEYADAQLPTEAQWEKAARGPNGNIYPWGRNTPNADLLNFNNNIGVTTNVIQYPKGKSYYDALDMEGNAYEWVHDWYDPNYYPTSPNQDPQGPDSSPSGERSVRASSFKSSNDQVITWMRSQKLQTDETPELGFRCVVKDPTFFAPACQLTSFVGQNLGGNPGQGSANPACPPPWFDVNGPNCNQPFGIVKVAPSQGETLVKISSSGGCVNIDNGKYQCTSAGSVSLTYTCSSAQVAPSCPQHYNLQNGICVWDGSGTGAQACPAGQQLQGNCCISTNGIGTNFSACPAGYQIQGNVCVQNGAPGGQLTQTVNVSDPPSKAQCTQSCQQPAGGCGAGNQWCKATCSCISSTKTCP